MNSIVHAQIRVQGQVQGVGFRPFVHQLARELGLSGWVRNDGAGVEIALEGSKNLVMNLVERLETEPPALSRVEQVLLDLAQPTCGFHGFNILASQAGKIQTGITPDAVVCSDCLKELFESHNRRYLYPFINCTHCGPRYTITKHLPYDRVNTSMAGFTLCPACQSEYDQPIDRRFHAQPNACSECGPQLQLMDSGGNVLETNNPLADSVAYIQSGQVLAVKGLGGFHLVCDAHNAKPIEKLRNAKRREEKPFAVMILNVASARQYAHLSENEASLLHSTERPIVLLNKSTDCDAQLSGIAPGLSHIGLMLPSTPLHYLLFHELLGKPAGTAWLESLTELALVMTSANPGGEPLVKDDAEAKTHLNGLANAFLTHNRDILHRCDDSVMRWQGDAPAFIRRARGFVPRRIKLPFTGPSILACGAWLKNTVCVTRDDEAFVSQHIGDLDHATTRLMLEDTVAHLCDILEVQPQAVAHDLHPDFFSTQFAQSFAVEHSLPIIPVQHHHAHIAAVCAEHNITESVIGLALDGVGVGNDGEAWGGELMLVNGAEFHRIGHLAPLAMPGGDHAARAPWRMAASVLFALGRGSEIPQRFSTQSGAQTVLSMLQRDLNCATTSSTGRLFDSAAGLLGIIEMQSYEGQAAMLLEGLAKHHGNAKPLSNGYKINKNGVLDFQLLLAVLADCDSTTYGAALFHATLADGLAAWVAHATQKHDVRCIALGGGCFLNQVLTQMLTDNLKAQGLRVITARQVPPNDGGISIGQAWVAINKMKGS